MKKTDAVKIEDSFECACEAGGLKSAEAHLRVSGDLLTLSRAEGDLSFSARQVSTIEIGTTDIKLTVAGKEVRISKLGRRFDKAAEAVNLWYRKGKLADSVVVEKHIEMFDDIEYELARRGRRGGSLRLYSTHAAVADSKNGRIKRIPYSYVRDILDEGLSVNIRMLKGPDVSLSMLGRRKEVLLRRMPELMEALRDEIGALAGRLFGTDSAELMAAAKGLLPDGRAALSGMISEKSHKLHSALAALLEGSRLASLYEAAEDVAFGLKKGLMGEIDGDYLFIFAKIGRAIVMDALSESESASRAAYVFKFEARDFAAFVDEMNWCLTNVGFRREPIYLERVKLEAPGNESYLQALEDVPELEKIRGLFLGRAAHTDDGGWMKKVLEIAGQ